jgi:hypothetical protein
MLIVALDHLLYEHNNHMGDTIMKKLLSILFSLSLVLGLGTGALADGQVDKEKQKAYKLIEKTNKDITHKIDKAVKEADKLQAKYFKDVQKLKKKEGVAEGDLAKIANPPEPNMNEVQGLILKVEEELFTAAKLENGYDHLLLVEDDIKDIASILVPCDNPVDGICKEDNGEKVYTEYKELTIKYLEELNKIIKDVYNETRALSEETIIIVGKVGINAVCDWIAVDFAHFTVWIDPIRVVGG